MTHAHPLLTAVLLAASAGMQAQVAYTYNDAGACTSRTRQQTAARAAARHSAAPVIRIVDFPFFSSSVTIVADSIAEGQTLGCTLSDAEGMTAVRGTVANGTNTLPTASLKPGIFFLRIYGKDAEMSYKLTKNRQ